MYLGREKSFALLGLQKRFKGGQVLRQIFTYTNRWGLGTGYKSHLQPSDKLKLGLCKLLLLLVSVLDPREQAKSVADGAD
jgi:hypothetical protein